VRLSVSDAAVSGNTISSNAGNGLNLHGSNDATISDNVILSNADEGMSMAGSDAAVRDNLILSNGGGGLSVFMSDATFINNVVADNREATTGSALRIVGSAPCLLHTTIARNSGGDGSAVHIRHDGEAYASPSFTNTILVGHTVGISVAAGNTATLESTLWGSSAWANDVDWSGAGTVLGIHNVWGAPGFANPDAGDYHLTPGSDAIDAGIDAGVIADIDGDPRPQGAGHDLGADEQTGAPQVSIALEPPAKTAHVGERFELTIAIHSGGQPVDGAEAHLNFDPTVLQVVDLARGTALPQVMQDAYDNHAGTIDYSAGLLAGTPPSGSFTLATVTFRALAETEGTVIPFITTAPRKTDVAYQGRSVLDAQRSARIVVEAGASLGGTVDLQGRPDPPDPAWRIPLTLTLHPPGGGDPLHTFAPTTDDAGGFSLSGIPPGSYQARVRGRHTLVNGREVTLASGANEVSFGMLHEGDANGDNCVTILDFSLLRMAFGACAGDGAFDGRADFNEDGCVTILDFSLLRTNFGRCGDIDVLPTVCARASADTDTVSIGLAASATTVAVGETFTLPIQIEAADQPVGGAEAHLDFDPRYLRVVDGAGDETDAIVGGEALPDELQNAADNGAGTIDYAAGALSVEPPTGTFTLGAIWLRAITETEATDLTFVFTRTRRTDVVFEAASVLGKHVDGEVSIVGEWEVYLPLVMAGG
jgi:parallel beta-helix repeat protein